MLDAIVKHGAERVVDDARDHLFRIRLLTDFQFHDESGQDQGVVGKQGMHLCRITSLVQHANHFAVREKAKSLVSLLNDTERIRDEREKSRKLASKLVGIGNDSQAGSKAYNYGRSYDADPRAREPTAAPSGRYGLGSGYTDGSPLPSAGGRTAARSSRSAKTEKPAAASSGKMSIKLAPAGGSKARAAQKAPQPPSDDEGDDGFDPFEAPAPAPAPAAAAAAAGAEYDPFAEPAPAPAPAQAPAPAPAPAAAPEDDLDGLFGSSAPAPAPAGGGAGGGFGHHDPFAAPAPAPNAGRGMGHHDPFAAPPQSSHPPQGGHDMFAPTAAAPAPAAADDFGAFASSAPSEPARTAPKSDLDGLVSLDGFALTGKGTAPKAATAAKSTKVRSGPTMSQLSGAKQPASTGLSGSAPTMPQSSGPMGGQPGYGQPMGQPGYGQPMGGQPGYGQGPMRR